MLLGIFILLLLCWGILQTEWGQNWLARQVTSKLSRDLQTHISIKHVKIGFFNFNKMDLEGVLVEDQKKDTLLYAGLFQVKITDWFFFKDKAELKYVGLEDAVINLNRTDSVWNYHFLEKYMSSSGDTTTKKSSGIRFDLKKVVMKNVTFNKKDAWLGSDLVARIGGLDMDADKITISNKTINVKNLVLDQPYFSLFDYTGRREYVTASADVKKTVEKTGKTWNIKFENIQVINGRFRDDKETMIPTTTWFDSKHIDFSKINGTFKNIGWMNDSITGNINLSAVERSGFVVKSLKAKTTVHPKAMIFDDLTLKTNRSTIGHYFAMKYDNLGSMSNFIHAVTMEANFSNTSISSDDIAYFSPNLKNWKKTLRVDGDVRGTVDALASKDLELWAGNNTYVHGAVSLVGLPNIKETLINIEASELRTTYPDAVSFIPSIRRITMPNLNKLTYLKFRGTYTGFINDFVTFGTLQTNLGTLQTDLNMKFPDKGEPVYAGSVSTEGFQLGTFINSPHLGLVDFHGNVKGRGFRWQTLDINIDGVIHRIQYGNYTYQNIKANGSLTNRLFNGEFLIKDPNADLQLNGLIDLTGKKPVFRVTADVAHADLHALQITPKDMQLSGKFNLDFEASSLSDLLGSARISDASLTSNGKRLSFDSLVVASSYINGKKNLTLVSNEFNVAIDGDFDLQGLPNAFTLFLSRYYPAYIHPPTSVTPQSFTFDISTGVVDDYIKLIDPRLSGFDNSHITGSLNTTANTMTVDADIPHFEFKQYAFSDVQLNGSGDLQKLKLNGQVTNAQISDSVFFPETNFSIEAQNDVSDITINTTSNQAINRANLTAQIKTFSDGASVLFKPSSFVLNGKTWSLEQGGELNFRRKTVVQGGVTFRESNQEIRLWTTPDTEGSWNNLHVAFQNVNIGDFSSFITNKNRIEGVLNGEAVVVDPQNRFDVNTDLHISELRFDNDSLGNVDAKFSYNNKTGIISGKANNLNPDHKIEIDLAMNIKDSTQSFQDRINTRLTNFELKYLNRFLGTIFSDINGYATGNFDIIGEGSNRSYTAKAKITDASFKVNFTQVTYWIDNTEIELKKELIDLDNIRIRDKEGNTALVRGYITHKGFQDMNYDIAVETESRQMELINTTYNDNQVFFGRAKGSGSFVLVGPQNDLLMNIDIRASETDSSFITLPPSRTRASGQASFMVERKYGREMTPQTVGASSNLNYDVHIAANPLVNISVILDDLTGDAIRGRGTGNLQITSGTSEPLAIQGRYIIDEGVYDFTFQSFLGKSFVLKKGGNNFIEWNGDPYDATVHLEAVYTAKQVSFAPLSNLFNTSVSGSSPNYSSIRDDVNVVAVLSGNLFHPNFDFRLEFSNSNVIYSNPDFTFALQQIEKNQNELNKQVTYLIVFNTFAPFENDRGSYNAFGEFTYSTISGLLFGKVNEQLNKILGKILVNNKATLNFTGSLYNRTLVDPNSKSVFRLPNQSNVNVSLGLPIFNDRARITLGATLDVPLEADYEQTIRLFPDVTLELKLNKSGSVRANFFYRQNIDYISGGVPGSIVPRRYGASIGYGKEFNTLDELFGKKKKKLPKNATEKSEGDSTGTHLP